LHGTTEPPSHVGVQPANHLAILVPPSATKLTCCHHKYPPPLLSSVKGRAKFHILASKCFHFHILYNQERGEVQSVQRASQPVESPCSISSTEALSESLGVRQSSFGCSSPEHGSSARILRIPSESWHLNSSDVVRVPACRGSSVFAPRMWVIYQS
jgi:hypothetical protein